jgi:hypothetical protein
MLVSNYKSLANPKDLLLAHKDNKFFNFKAKEVGNLENKIINYLKIKPIQEKQLGEM